MLVSGHVLVSPRGLGWRHGMDNNRRLGNMNVLGGLHYSVAAFLPPLGAAREEVFVLLLGFDVTICLWLK